MLHDHKWERALSNKCVRYINPLWFIFKGVKANVGHIQVVNLDSVRYKFKEADAPNVGQITHFNVFYYDFFVIDLLFRIGVRRKDGWKLCTSRICRGSGEYVLKLRVLDGYLLELVVDILKVE